MNGRFVVFLLLLVCSVNAVKWGPSDFPDPKRDVNLCGRGGRSSNICDPDQILTEKGANRIEGVIKDIQDGIEPYIRVKCANEGVIGFQVGGVASSENLPISPLYLTNY